MKQRTNRLAWAHQAEACLLPLGPSLEVTRESFPKTPHPRCLPPKSALPVPGRSMAIARRGFLFAAGVAPSRSFRDHEERGEKVPSAASVFPVLLPTYFDTFLDQKMTWP